MGLCFGPIGIVASIMSYGKNGILPSILGCLTMGFFALIILTAFLR